MILLLVLTVLGYLIQQNNNFIRMTSLSSSSSKHHDVAKSHVESLVVRRGDDDAIEAIAGTVSAEYDCVYDNTNGTLYAGSNALYFLGYTFFLFADKKVILRWQDIRQVQKLDQGIGVMVVEDHHHADADASSSITTSTKTKTSVYHFTGMHAPDRVWVLLVSLHNDALLERPPGHRLAPTPRSLKRRNSDPLLASTIHCLDETVTEQLKQDAMMSAMPSTPETTTSDQQQQEARKKKDQERPTEVTSSLFTPGIIASSLEGHAVEAVAGKLSLQPISCSYNNLKGKLYTGKAAVYFYARKFFWDKQEILLKWEAIRHIQIVDAATKNKERICVGLQFVTTEDETFRFLGMQNADTVWVSLIALHNEVLTTNSRKKLEQQQQLSTHSTRGSMYQHRRMNSDPNLATTQDLLEEDEEDETSNEDTAGGGLLKSAPPRVLIHEETGEEQQQEEKTEEKWDDKEDWENLVSDSDYDHVVIKDHVLNCSLDTYVELFLQDDAKFSISKYLESIGDSNLRVLSWEKDGAVKRSRIVRYTHPVNAPLAPPSADARKEQSYRRYGEHGLCVWTKTYVDDVPMADCFYVSDRVRVEPKGDDQVSVIMEFEITFVKSTMFKGIISKTTSSEVTDVFQGLAKFMSEALGGAPPEELIEPTKVLAPEKSWVEVLATYATVPLLLIVILFQVWIMTEVRELKQAVRELQVVDAMKATSTSAAAQDLDYIPDHLG